MQNLYFEKQFIGTLSKTEYCMKPIIGVSGVWSNETFDNQMITSDFHYVAAAYTNAIYFADGIPMIVVPDTREVDLESAAAEIVGKIDALMLSGGGDVGIKNSGQPKPTLFEQQRRRYTFEAFLLKSAWERDIPVMGICRGQQMMAEVLGGSIKKEFIQGHTSTDEVEVFHKINIKKTSKLLNILKSNHWMVNSYHRQAIATVPDGFEISAVSEDGVIEAIEAKDKKFYMGFQFHPELLLPNDKNAIEIFKAFLASIKSS